MGTKQGDPRRSATVRLPVDGDNATFRLLSGKGSLDSGRDMDPKVVVLVRAPLLAAAAGSDAAVDDARCGAAGVPF